jgi:hypothetical protein
MSEKDVVENVDSPGEIGIPTASNSTPGIASFDSNDFTVGPDGKVSSIVERGIPQYLGKITGTGTGTTDLNWEVDTNTVKQNKPIKLGEYIMLTEHFNQFVSGDIFRITNVQIEGSKYTVKTNNVRALSLASIVGPQGEQGSEGPQGVPYLAYTGSIESTADPTVNALMYLDNGHFNRTPIATSDTYRDVVTVDWYNKTTHRAFMVTGLIQGKNNATNQWVAEITAKTDITGAVGPQGKEGAGIADIVDIDYPHGEFTSVQYDTADGIKMQGIAKYLRDDGETYQIPTDIDVPLVACEGLSMDKKATKEQVEIKSLNSNLENGTDDVLIQTTDTNHSFKVMKDGSVKVKTAPINYDDVVRLEDLNSKCVLRYNASVIGERRAYVVNPSGWNETLPIHTTASGDDLPIRTRTGQLKASDGVENDDLVTVKQLNEIGGGKLYLHNIRLNAQFTYNDNASGDFLFSFTANRQTKYKLQDLTTLFNAFGSNIITTATIRKQESGSMPHNGIANVLYSEGADVLEIRAFITDGNTVTGYYKTGSLGDIKSLQDTVTEF